MRFDLINDLIILHLALMLLQLQRIHRQLHQVVPVNIIIFLRVFIPLWEELLLTIPLPRRYLGLRELLDQVFIPHIIAVHDNCCFRDQ